MAYYKILVIACEYRTYTVPADDAEQAQEFLRLEGGYAYEVGNDVDELPEIQEVWEA